MPVIHIVTGEVNAGKTTLMRTLFHFMPVSDGLLSEKIYVDGDFSGYRLVHLQSGETRELALLQKAYLGQFREACRLGSFVFSSEAFRFGLEILERQSANPAVRTLFLDEAGPLELNGQGFAGVLPALLLCGKSLYITVRRGCLEEFLRKFEILEYQLIPVPSGEY